MISPTLAAGHRFENDVAGVEERSLVDGREDHGRGPQKSVFAGSNRLGRNVLDLSRSLVESRQFAAVDYVRIERIGRDITVFLDTDGAPVSSDDRARVAAR
ncbi:MAG: hypothetical protein IPJ30_23295 [Acidobacteria bacterium]|nr:hypothetical protein [Acidobacteriota bacterium]